MADRQKSVDAAKHVEPKAECLRTRVRFPPPPPVSVSPFPGSVPFRWPEPDAPDCRLSARRMSFSHRDTCSANVQVSTKSRRLQHCKPHIYKVSHLPPGARPRREEGLAGVIRRPRGTCTTCSWPCRRATSIPSQYTRSTPSFLVPGRAGSGPLKIRSDANWCTQAPAGDHPPDLTERLEHETRTGSPERNAIPTARSRGERGKDRAEVPTPSGLAGRPRV